MPVSARSGFSAQTLSVLAALCAQPSRWYHGYALAGQTGLKSGMLYPILIRLAATVDALADATGPTAEPAAVQAGTRRVRAGARTAPVARGAVAGVVP